MFFGTDFQTMVGDIEFGLLFSVLPFMIWLSLFCKPLIKISETKIVKFLYSITTSVYVYHHPFLWTLISFTVFYKSLIQLNSIFTFLMFIFFIIIISFASNRFVEKKLYNFLSFIFGADR